MIIQDCTFTPILIDSRSLRKGILLTLTSQDGEKASAEISPLPGYSRESLEDAQLQLRLLERRLLNTWWSKQTLQSLFHLDLYPSVHFGVESALLDLLDPLPKEQSCPQYALLLGSPQEISQRADEVYEQGFRHAKVKLGHLPLPEAHQIIEIVDDRFSLRIDLNRKWSLEQTLSFCKNYAPDTFEYIEEPAHFAHELAEFPYPFALDESIRENWRCLEPLAKLKQFKAIILKPTMIYPLSRFFDLGKKIVLTSSFEGPTGIAQIRKLAQRLKLLSTHHGLDTLRYFEKGAEHGPMSHRPLERAAT